MNVLITGGAGYIGSCTANFFLDKGCSVTIIDNLSTGTKNLVPKKAKFYKLSVQNRSVLKILKENMFDLVIHFAGFIQVEESVNKPKKYLINNFQNTIKFFEYCKISKLKFVIFSSTAAVYGIPREKLGSNLINENNKINPINPYALSKLKVENFLKKNKFFKSIILRYFNVAGADPQLRSGQVSKNKTTHLIKNICEKYILNRKIKIFGNDYPSLDGTAIRDYIHVYDLAELHYLSALYLLKKKTNNLFNCGYGVGFSVLEVINTFNKIVKKKIEFKFTKRRPGDVFLLVADNAKIIKFLKWRPKFQSLKKILSSSLKWELKLKKK